MKDGLWFLAALASFVAGAILDHKINNCHWQTLTVTHGAAHYDPYTANWQWNDGRTP